ncbi:putative Peptidase A1 domain-containing protein [Seiridium cardinale]|uniref:Peptidase A1 domain-containing protein n=1 Tax=Seiridium cardinale TaxID=138064 RepID=A0ABR2Y1F4_9PEZI
MKSVLALSWLSAALALPAAKPASQKVALGTRNLLTHPSGEANIAGIYASLNHTLHKYNLKPLPYYEPVAKKQAEIFEAQIAKRQVNEPITDQTLRGSADIAYYGSVGIGGQNFNVIFDTGSAEVWVPGPSCTRANGCVHTSKYDQGGSDLGTKTSLQYVSGMTEGENYVDDFTIAGLTAINQTLISVTTAFGFNQSDADGVAGMAFSTIARNSGTTFFENLVAQSAVQADEFGFYLGRVSRGTQNDSELTLGGRDSTKYKGEFVTVPVSSRTHWQIALDGVKVGGTTVANTQGQAAIDTGTTLLLAPTAAAAAVFAQIKGSFGLTIKDMKMYLYPCSTADSNIPSITFAGVDLAINPLDFKLGTVGLGDIDDLALGNAALAAEIREKIASEAGGYCFAGFSGTDLPDIGGVYIVGNTFIKNWYSVFSYSAADGQPAVLFAPNIGQS